MRKLRIVPLYHLGAKKWFVRKCQIALLSRTIAPLWTGESVTIWPCSAAFSFSIPPTSDRLLAQRQVGLLVNLWFSLYYFYFHFYDLHSPHRGLIKVCSDMILLQSGKFIQIGKNLPRPGGHTGGQHRATPRRVAASIKSPNA